MRCGKAVRYNHGLDVQPVLVHEIWVLSDCIDAAYAINHIPQVIMECQILLTILNVSESHLQSTSKSSVTTK